MISAKQMRRLRLASVGLLLFFLPLPLLLKAVLSLWGDNPQELAATGGCWLLFLLGAVLCRRGLQAEVMSEERPFAARRGARLKMAGGAVIGFATALTAYVAAGHSLPIAIAFALVAATGYYLLYGRPPPPSPASAGARMTDDEEATDLLRDAYARLDSIAAASRQIASPEFRQRLGSIVGSAEQILKLVADDPRDLRRARKFVTVYLDGAQRITRDYARAHSGGAPPAELEHNFRTLLVDMQNTCDEQYRKLLQNDLTDLEIQIEVLSTRLRREGVA